MAYTKLDAGITESTVWATPDSTRLTWITMLALADQNGYVGASIPGLASRARVTLEGCLAAIECFMSPDPYSRTKDFEGRRIAEADGGWVLLNHAKYRAKQDADDRRERSRVAMARLRAQRKQEFTSANGYQPLTSLASRSSKLSQAEAEAEAEEKKETPTEGAAKAAGAKAPSRRASAPDDVAPEVWADWLELRRVKRAPVTITVLKDAREEAAKAGMSLEAFLREWCSRGSQGLRADWIKPTQRKSAGDIFDGAI